MKALPLLFVLVALGSPAGAVLIPGGGPPRSDCYLEFDVQARELSARIAECTDGDPTCDLDGACDGGCRFGVAVCLNQHDPSLPNCTPPFPPTGLLRVQERGRDQVGLRIPDFASSACGAFVSVDTPASRRKRTGRRIRTLAISPERPARDRDLLRLVCRAPAGGCPTTTTTSTTTVTSPSTTTTTMGQAQIIARASADTAIFSGSPDQTLGSATQVFVGNDASNSQRALLRFDLSGVPAGATLLSCVLGVHVVTLNEAGPGHVYRVKQTAWSETMATWNRYDGVNAWTTPGAFNAAEAMSDVVVTAGPDGPIAYAAPPSGGAFAFPDLLSLCEDAIANHAGELDLLIKQDADAPGATAEFSIARRTDSVEEERPTLEVVFAP
jgi:hypothetical protein